jgi:aldose 1-epimerase
MKATTIIARTWLFAWASACSSSSPPPAAAPEQPAAAEHGAEPAAAQPESASISKQSYGQVDGKEVSLFTLTNTNGLSLEVTNYGTIITEFHVPDRDGKLGDIVLGYENL